MGGEVNGYAGMGAQNDDPYPLFPEAGKRDGDFPDQWFAESVLLSLVVQGDKSNIILRSSND
jgi:hypothetical protein